MKIQCQSCQAKYTIADEKVLGKVVKIRCKKCSATIVINGNETRSAAEDHDTNVFDYASQSNEQWTVNVADGDQRTLASHEIVAEYRAGAVNDETYCWKDGMGDWLPLREIEPLYRAVKLSPRPSFADDEISIPPQSIPNPPLSGGGAPLFASPAAELPALDSSPFAGGAPLSGGNLFGGGGLDQVQTAPAAARRGGGRGQGADLFGNVSSAGAEEDVMTSAANAAIAASTTAEDAKLTGQRNENSVLFSLSALTEGGDAPRSSSSSTGGFGGGGGDNKTTATSDGSGLIDIRALSANMGSDEGAKRDKGSRVDDIMNLSGGGAFGAALAAPILAPPPLEMSSMMPGGMEQQNKSNKALLFGIIGAGAFIAIAIVVAVLLLRPVTPPPTTADTNGTAAALPGTTTATVAGEPNTAAPTNRAASAANDTPPAPGTGEAKPGANVKAPAGGDGRPVVASAPKDTPAPRVDTAAATPKPADPPKDFGSALAAAAGSPKATADTGGAGGSSAPFDRGAAAAALGGINVQSCKKNDGPAGGGHVKVTFSSNGQVSAAVIDSGPFPGTAVGGCIAGKFRGAHVPAFGGAPVTVGKSFTVN